ncbi:MAG: hypothetical protein Q7R68_04360, partial [Nitrospirales bacterium]|nr:hypothetical protein [Nitrospirales bacterium]
AAVLAFVASVIAVGVSAYSVRFSRFAKERWWERKAEAYSRIVEALAGLVYYHEEHYDAELESRSIPEDRRRQIDEYWRTGYIELKKATAAGPFLISAEAEAALAQMWRDRGKGVHPGDWFGRIESDYTTARDGLKAVVAAAKKDLAVT